MKEDRHERLYIVRFHLCETSRKGNTIETESCQRLPGAMGGWVSGWD